MGFRRIVRQKIFSEKVLDKTESRHYNFLPINGLFVIKFRLWRACASRETCNRFQIENQIQIQFSNLKSFSDSFSKSDSKSFSAQKQKRGNLKSPCFCVSSRGVKVRTVSGLWALCGEKFFENSRQKPLTKLCRRSIISRP